MTNPDHNIEIYASKLAAEPLETFAGAYVTIEQWLINQSPAYRTVEQLAAEGREPPISVEHRSVIVPPAMWSQVMIQPGDRVRIVIEAKGGAFDAVGKLFSGIINAVFKLFVNTPKVKDNSSQTGQGQELYGAQAKGNKPKLGAVIPEIAGRMRVYPDYLVPPRRWFEDKRTQKIEMLLCVGRGHFQIPAENVVVGDTPIISLGSGGEFQIFGPGEDVSGHPASIHWHEAPEVGGTSTGTSGIKLQSTYTVDRNPEASSYRFSGTQVVITSGAGSFPDGWQSGMIARIDGRQDVVVYDGGTAPDYITGDFEALAPYEGMPLEITGDNAGTYVVDSYSHSDDEPGRLMLRTAGGEPVTWLKTGTLRSGFGFPGLRYQLVSATRQTITVSRITDTGEEDQDWIGFSPAVGGEDGSVMLDRSTTEGDWAGAFMGCPIGTTTKQFEFDIMAPAGLTRIKDNGSLRDQSVTIELQYRDIAERGAWTSIRKTYTDRTLDQLGFTHRVNLPYAMRPEVRIRRIGEQSTDTQIQDEVQWYGLRSRIDAPRRYEGMTTIAVTLLGGERLSSQSENQIWVTPTRMLPVRRNGAWQPMEATRDIVPWVLHVLRSIGYTDDDLDLKEFDRLHSVWAARGDYYDAKIDQAGTAMDAVKESLAVGYADVTILDGLIRPVRDEPRTQFEHQYSPQIMTDALSRQYTPENEDDNDAWEVEYVSSVTWQTDTVNAFIPGSERRKVKKIKADGITDRTRAWRLGMREAAKTKWQRYAYQWTTELDALNSRYLSYVPVSEDVPGYGQSAWLESYAELEDGRWLVTLSEPLTWEERRQHVIGMRKPDGRSTRPLAVEPGLDANQVICEAPGFTPDLSGRIEPPFVQFGTAERWVYPVLVMSAEASGFDQASIKGVNYDDRIYQFDDQSPQKGVNS